MFAQRRITLRGVSSMCITSRARQRGPIFLYPGLNNEEEALPCCDGRVTIIHCLPVTTKPRQHSGKKNEADSVTPEETGPIILTLTFLQRKAAKAAS